MEAGTGMEMEHGYKGFIFKVEDAESLNELNKLRHNGWEITSMAPFRMVPDAASGSTVVREYFVILLHR